MQKSLITGHTRICGIMGDPVEHTVSPAMHNTAFLELGLDYVYIPFRVSPAELSKAVKGLHALNMRGTNVTIPHKVAVMKQLDNIDPLALKIGAVNTIVNNNGQLMGFNTDADGFIKPLLERKINLKGMKVAVLGSGGAARAVCFALAGQGADLTILNRAGGMSRAEELAVQIRAVTGKNTPSKILDRKNSVAVLKASSLLVNATSAGMSPNADESPVDGDLLSRGMIVYDIVYNPLKTKLLEDAEAAGANTIGGLEMLAWQGAQAFELWTGAQAPVATMLTAAKKALAVERPAVE